MTMNDRLIGRRSNIYYHGTAPSSLPGIAKDGLLANPPSTNWSPGHSKKCVYLAVSTEYAYRWGGVGMYRRDGSREKGDAIVLKVDLNTLSGEVCVDGNNDDRDYMGPTWEYWNDIPPEHIYVEAGRDYDNEDYNNDGYFWKPIREGE